MGSNKEPSGRHGGNLPSAKLSPQQAQTKAISERISKLQECDLKPMDAISLEFLQRRPYLNPDQLLLLKRMEDDYL